MNIIHQRTLWFSVTATLFIAAVAAIVVFGLHPSIDFTGGSSLQIKYEEARPSLSDIQQRVDSLALGTALVRASGEAGVSIRVRTLTPDEHQSLFKALSEDGSITELAFTSVGPALGNQFARKALWALLAVAVAIMLYIAFVFRKVSRPVPSIGYGLTVLAILIHDLVIPAGFFAVLGYVTGAEVDALFITALLALLGYSVNDTIVIFDRVREHLARNQRENVKETFEETVGKSITETIGRSINTSLTTALGLCALVFFGADVTRNFALVLLVGVIAGTYSSILVAAPLLVPLSRYFIRPKA
jgi:preprotein translocase subunit SecF